MESQELKTYAEWCPILEAENGVKIIDDDGGRLIIAEGNTKSLLTREKAARYFVKNTIKIFNCKELKTNDFR